MQNTKEKIEKYSDEVKDPEILFNDVIKEFDTTFFIQLIKIKNPSKNLRNIILIFLTIFHKELDELVQENSSPSKDQYISQLIHLEMKTWILNG